MARKTLRLAIALLVFSSLTLPAEVKVCAVFGPHMVLQREMPIRIWGTAAAGEAVSVTLGDTAARTTADGAGRWRVELPARSASATPVDLTIAGANKIVFHDVLIGDVWVASGQSNMDWAFFWGNGVLNTQEEMANANYPLIRDCKVVTTSNAEPQDDMRAGWSVCTPKLPGSKAFTSGIERFTATGYFFARALHQKLSVPIGLINSSLGGSIIEAWLDPATAQQFSFINARWQQRVADYPAQQAKYVAAKSAWDAEKATEGPAFKKPAPMAPPPLERDPSHPSGLFNAMIHPFLGLSFKGVIWYQGENNVKRAAEYRQLFPALITGWRRDFGIGAFPFYWVQLSNYDFESRPTGTEWAFLREAQTMTLALPNTGQAVTIDIGDATNIHLRNKQEVGRRLALLALARTYGFHDIVDSGPVFDHADFSSSPVKAYFQSGTGPLVQRAGANALGGFELAGDDHVFHPAQAQIGADGSFVSVSCAEVPRPVALRYAWRNDPKNLGLVNPAQLPARPFRTDAWPEDPAELQKK